MSKDSGKIERGLRDTMKGTKSLIREIDVLII